MGKSVCPGPVKLRVKRVNEFRDRSWDYLYSHQGGLRLDLHLCPAATHQGQALVTHIFLHFYADLDYSSSIQAWEPRLKHLRYKGTWAIFGMLFP